MDYPIEASPDFTDADLPYLLLPETTSSGNDSSVVMDRFFSEHPEAAERIIFCPKINRDLTDDWGVFGYEPGYIFVTGRFRDGVHTLNEATIYGQIARNRVTMRSGHEVSVLPHYDSFPYTKYGSQIITQGQGRGIALDYIHNTLFGGGPQKSIDTPQTPGQLAIEESMRELDGRQQ